MPPNRWFSTMAAALLAAVAAGVEAHGQGGGSSYTVNDVAVDIAAPDAVQAREQGIREARRKAAALLVERMVPAEDRAKVPTPDDARLQSMVRGVEFVSERPAPGRYSATLNVVFSPGPVRAWLGESGVRIVETVSRPALVIPLWKGPAGVEPLDDRNAWREAWRTLDTAGSAVPVTLLRADQLDLDALSAEQAYIGDVSALARLTERYRMPVIVVMTVEGDKDSGPLTVGGLRYDAQTGARTEIAKETVPGVAQLPDAARKVHARLDEQWRSMATVRRESQDALEVYVPIRALGDWVQIRQRLGSVPAVRTIQVRSLEADRADLRLEYFGTPDELQRILALAGLTLDRDADKWRLQAR